MLTLKYGGDSLWGTDQKRDIRVTKMNLVSTYDDGDNFAELRVYFSKKNWNPEKHGLIYTDRLFERELNKFFQSVGFSRRSRVEYSEQGMQGDDYVSLDATPQFIRLWPKLKEKVRAAIKAPATYIGPQCNNCGSRNILRDAWAEWDAQNQKWVLGPLYDYSICEGCGGETSTTWIGGPEPA